MPSESRTHRTSPGEVPASWSITPISPAGGARIDGVALDAPLTDEHADALRSLLDEHLVVVLPDAPLDEAGHVALGRRFGEPYVHPFLEAVRGHPEVLDVLKRATDASTFGGDHWHADITFTDPPASVSLLHAVELPPFGGDTLFANQFLAHDHLSAGLASTLEGLRAVHVYPGMDERDPGACARHPVVRVHPTSRRRALSVNSAFVTRFEGMSPQESAPLLRFLHAHQIRPEFQFRVSWAPNQLVLWDNRAVLHYAMNDYPGHRRHLRRVTVLER